VTSAPGSPPPGVEAPGPGGAAAGDTKRPPWKSPFLIAFLVGAVILTVLPFLQQAALRAPEPITSLGAWELVDEHGKPYGSAELKGSVWIASFFFTRCPSVCPAQQQALVGLLPHLEDLQGKSGVAPIAIVSFTVDPEHDTPELLQKYEEKMRPAASAKGGEWKLLTGEREQMKELLIKRFLVPMGEREPLQGAPDLFDISHVAKFALVDQNGDVRGYWGIDDLGRGNLINAARLLAKKGPRP
jgi:protein SCO1